MICVLGSWDVRGGWCRRRGVPVPDELPGGSAGVAGTAHRAQAGSVQAHQAQAQGSGGERVCVSVRDAYKGVSVSGIHNKVCQCQGRTVRFVIFRDAHQVASVSGTNWVC